MPPNVLLQFNQEDGKRTEVQPDEFRALTLYDLNRLTADAAPSIEMAFRGKVHDAAKVRSDEVVTGTANVTFDKPPRPYALVKDGWLPMPFVFPRQFFVDRNVVSKLKSLTTSRPRASDLSFTWWMQALLDDRLALNPLPYAWESAKRQQPTFVEFEAELVRARQEILQALPMASVTVFNKAMTTAAFDQLVKFENRENRQIAFLIEIAPDISNLVADAKIEKVKQRVFAAAIKHAVPRRSLVMIAVLSALFESNEQKSIGRSLVKPRFGYTAADAYNAISDLRTIELLAMSHAMVPNTPTALATDDIALAKFWCALGLKVTNPIVGGYKFAYSLSDSLFARLTVQQIGALNTELHVDVA